MEWMAQIKDNSVDLILCDLPYGTTQNKWDSILPFEELWEQYNRIAKDNAAIVLFSAQPFTSLLIQSNLKNFKYEWIWHKTHPKGHLNAKKQPMRAHENICVFYKKQPTYNPQMTTGHQRKVAKSLHTRKNNRCYGKDTKDTFYDSTERYPLDVQLFSNGDQRKKMHPTQKPVELCEYLIKTYTNESDVVLDNCIGSGTTAVACINTNRRFIGIEKEWDYCKVANKRIEEAEAMYTCEELKLGDIVECPICGKEFEMTNFDGEKLDDFDLYFEHVTTCDVE